MVESSREFADAYAKAMQAILDAVMEFERVTEDEVLEVQLDRIDVTTFATGKRVERIATLTWRRTAEDQAGFPWPST